MCLNSSESVNRTSISVLIGGFFRATSEGDRGLVHGDPVGQTEPAARGAPQRQPVGAVPVADARLPQGGLAPQDRPQVGRRLQATLVHPRRPQAHVPRTVSGKPRLSARPVPVLNWMHVLAAGRAPQGRDLRRPPERRLQRLCRRAGRLEDEGAGWIQHYFYHNQWCGVLRFFHVLPLLLLWGSIHSQSSPDPLLTSIYSKNPHINNRYLTIIDTTTKRRVLCIILARTISQERLVNRKIAPSLFAMKSVFSLRARVAKNLPAGPLSIFSKFFGTWCFLLPPNSLSCNCETTLVSWSFVISNSSWLDSLRVFIKEDPQIWVLFGEILRKPSRNANAINGEVSYPVSKYW